MPLSLDPVCPCQFWISTAFPVASCLSGRLFVLDMFLACFSLGFLFWWCHFLSIWFALVTAESRQPFLLPAACLDVFFSLTCFSLGFLFWWCHFLSIQFALVISEFWRPLPLTALGPETWHTLLSSQTSFTPLPSLLTSLYIAFSRPYTFHVSSLFTLHVPIFFTSDPNGPQSEAMWWLLWHMDIRSCATLRNLGPFSDSFAPSWAQRRHNMGNIASNEASR